jgi:hypothetical protein
LKVGKDVRSKEYFTALREKAEAERAAAEISTKELNKFVYKRLKNLQKVGRSVLSKSFGTSARYRAPEGTPNEYKWVSQPYFAIKAIRDEKSGTVIVVSNNVFAGEKETLTKMPLETIYLSDRAFATAIRKAILTESDLREKKLLTDLEKQLSKIRKNPNLSTVEKAAIMSAKGLLGVFASAS